MSVIRSFFNSYMLLHKDFNFFGLKNNVTQNGLQIKKMLIDSCRPDTSQLKRGIPRTKNIDLIEDFVCSDLND